MGKRITLSFTDLFWERYISKYNGNVSKYIEELATVGAETLEGDLEMDKSKFHKAMQELRDRDDKIKKLKAKLGRYESKERDPDVVEAEKMVDSLKAGDFLNDDN